MAWSDKHSVNVSNSSITAGGHAVVGAIDTRITTIDSGASGPDPDHAATLKSIVELVNRIQGNSANVHHPSPLNADEVMQLRDLADRAASNGGRLPEPAQAQARGLRLRIQNFLVSAGEQTLLAAFLAMVGLA